ncbi:MAG: hypothetical protein VCD00_15010 [Candidatus Hydrogenedentota bacterium]
MRPSSNNRCHRQNEGFVLVTVIWILAILTVITLGFSHRAMMERRAAWYGMDQAQARGMARGAIQRAILELRNKQMLDTYRDPGWYTSPRSAPYTAYNQRWSRRINLMNEARYFAPVEGAQSGDDICTYTISDCSARISLNDAPRELFESIDELDFQLIGAILARRDAANFRQQPYRFVTVDEVLTLEEGSNIDYTSWMGEGNSDGLRSLFTVWSDPNDGLINVNTASLGVLERIPELDESVLTRIIEYRVGADGIPYTGDDRAFRSLDTMSKQLEISYESLDPIRKYCKTDSRLFRITAHATRRRGTINAFCTVVVELQGNDAIIKDWKEGFRAS